jgi:diaminohydroxyphosphoribosylaminopyrimidine deaminase/5-amino-6-(5-phosphoribosylamino)uracil reductase
MVDARDEAFMARAAFLAERGRGRTSPNPLVGAVVVDRDGVIVGQGAHLQAGLPHAEIAALDQAGARARGATLYCTLEPCCHTGRTGPCVERIVSDGIGRVVFAVQDPNPAVDGGGERFLRAHGVSVERGPGEAAARRQNAAFFTWITARRPFVIVKAAVSADGFVGRPDRAVRLTSPATDRYFHRQRAEVDALAVGSGTVIVDDPLLTARVAYRSRPLVRVLFDWRLRIPAAARVFSTLSEGPVIMIVGALEAERHAGAVIALERRGISIERRETRRIGPVLNWLGARQVTSLLVEGGPALHQAFFEENLVDRCQIAVTPGVLREGTPVAPALAAGDRWAAPDAGRRLGPDRLVEWDVHRTD